MVRNDGTGTKNGPNTVLQTFSYTENRHLDARTSNQQNKIQLLQN